MSDFKFNDSESFENNCEEFLKTLKADDAEMADILRDNWDTLVAIVREGERESKVRGDFNVKVSAALDTILNAPGPKGGA